MSKTHFQDCLTRMQENANGRKISVERSQAIWAVVQHFEDRDMDKITSEWCAESNAIPTRGDILTLINKLALRKGRKKTPCLWCGGEGMVEAYCKQDPSHTVMFRCSCPNSYHLSKDFISLSAEARKKWQPLKHGEMAPDTSRSFVASPGSSAKGIGFSIAGIAADVQREIERRGI